MLAVMLSGMCASVQSELDQFFAGLAGSTGRLHEVSDTAFRRARRGFSATAFERLNSWLLDRVASRIDAHRWQGLRVVAADASRLSVGTRAGAELARNHWAFALFLPGAELTLHGSLHPAEGSERQMLYEALGKLQAGADVLVLDRGYVGNATVAWLDQLGHYFCLRVDAARWNCVRAFLRSNEAEREVILSPPERQECATYEMARRPTRVRLVRDVTPTGRVRVLMTNLLNGQRFPAADFGSLYHRRWRVEEAFKRIKHRLDLEAVSGLTYLALQQDFAAKLLADNLCAVLALADVPDDAPSRPNRTYAQGALRAILAPCLLGIAYALEALAPTLAAIDHAFCRKQPARSTPRRPRTKPHRHLAYKRVG